MTRSGKTMRLIDEAVQSLFEKIELYLLRKQALSRSGFILKNNEALFIDPDHKM